VNDKPVATDGSASGAEDGSPISVDLTALVGDVETADANLTYHIVSGPSAAQGTLIVSSTGVYSFTPAANFNGSFDITYNADDRGDPDNCGAVSTSCAASKTSDTKKVTITVTPVNDPPVATDGSASGAEDGSPISVDLTALVGDVETADANLTYHIVSGPSAAQGTLIVSSTGVYSFTPAANFNGSFDITYNADDRGDPDNCGAVSTSCAASKTSDTKKVTITVTPVER